MNTIDIIEKPDYISFEDIRTVIHAAHAKNIEKGITMRSTTLSAEELEDAVGTDGKTFVALDGECLVGTMSCRIIRIDRWFCHGDVMKLMFVGVLPEYQGKRIASKLLKKIEEETLQSKIEIVYLDTAAQNDNMISFCKKKGYKLLNYFPARAKHYSVEMGKWMTSCPYSDLYCACRFYMRKIYIQIRFKPGRVKRFGI